MAMSETSARVGVGWTWRGFYSLDMSILDFDISYSISFVLCTVFEVFAVIVMMAIVTSKVLIVAIPVMIIMVFVQNGKYAIVTDRWQKFTDVFLDEQTLVYLAAYADKFLVHGVDVERKRLGIDEELVASARELVRINGTTKAPVVNYAAESVLGGVTIRVFSATERFIHNKLRLIDTDAALFFYTIAAMDWVIL